jgi:hypothetical protein
MTFVSMYINHKLRPTYRQWGHDLGEHIANTFAVNAEQRQKIIKISTVATSVGLSLGCAVLTADAVGATHALSAGMHAELAHASAGTHAEIASNAAATHTDAVYPAPVTGGPVSYAAQPDTAGALAGFNQQSNIMASVAQHQADEIAASSTDASIDSVSDGSF